MTREPDCGHLALIASGEAQGLCPLCQRAEIEQLRALLRRHHLRGAYWDSDLAVETRAALEPKP